MDTNRRAIYGLDQIEPFELAPTTYSVKGKIDFNRIRYDNGLEGRGIMASQSNLLMEKYITITVVDRVTDKVLFRCDKAAVIDQNWSIRSREIATGSLSFEALFYTTQPET